MKQTVRRKTSLREVLRDLHEKGFEKGYREALEKVKARLGDLPSVVNRDDVIAEIEAEKPKEGK